MAVNKVEINGETKLDLTQDTVTPENLLSGGHRPQCGGGADQRRSCCRGGIHHHAESPGTAAVGTEQKYARGDHVHPSERPKATQVTLTAAGWDSGTKKQTVTVSGVLADTSKQVIWVAFASETALDAYMDAGIVPVAQGANTVTFRADKVPTADISVTVLMQGVLT